MGYVGQAPAAGSVTTSDITDGTIANADIASDAAIALSKTALSAGTNITLSTNTLNVDDAFLVNNASDATSGTVTMAHLIIGDGGNIGSASDTDALTIASGGKVTFSQGFAVGSDAAGDILYHNGTSYIRLAKGSADQVLTMNDGATAPGWETAASSGASQALATTLGMIFNF